MAKDPARKPRPKADPVDPTDHAHNPDTEHGTHPAAAPLGTDEEAGRRAPRPGAGMQGDTVQAIDSQGEVRAGPGDAGRQDAPRGLDDPHDTSPRSGMGLFIAALVAGPLFLFVSWILLS
ncbi:hypothetical protein [Tateyamaria omphalii]|uniref:Uncharacterized protein n=1 Tax=Tateyamaria omphalii TaxID=299262 RepID=A0A1P8MR96_9RHOB|nr:hypothetical protein [Tateyamaria omphalii]APX10571.1 hypothetical protein BWR18_01805 [Tateyamaria omphalii]